MSSIFECFQAFFFFSLFCVGQSLARLSGSLLKATCGCLLLRRSAARSFFSKMLPKLQGLDEPAGPAALRSVRGRTVTGSGVN